MYRSYQDYCLTLKDKSIHRQLQENYKKGIDFSSNDYLCLSKSKDVLDAAIIAGSKYGVGSTGSRLLSGNQDIFQELEEKISKDKKTESSLIFNTGFQANISVLSSLLNPKILGHIPLVFFDKLNHSSLYNGVFLGRGELIRYNHANMQHLSDLLAEHKNDSRKKFIVTETIFGMDGDIAPLREIISLAKKHNCFLYLDEAHATGMFGSNGYGLSTCFDLSEIPHLIMGTFSKALGCFGSYIACSKIIKSYILNTSPGFIYSTSLPPMIIAAASKAWDKIAHLNKERSELFSKAEMLRHRLCNLSYDVGNSVTHIIPILIKNEVKVISLKNELAKNNIIVSAIRPPTVPPKTARLRIALNTEHTYSDIDQLLDIISSIM